MKTIYKYPLEPENSIFFDLPRGAEIISVQEQYGMFNIYAVVDTDEAETERFEVLLYGTGHNTLRPTSRIISSWGQSACTTGNWCSTRSTRSAHNGRQAINRLNNLNDSGGRAKA